MYLLARHSAFSAKVASVFPFYFPFLLTQLLRTCPANTFLTVTRSQFTAHWILFNVKKEELKLCYSLKWHIHTAKSLLTTKNFTLRRRESRLDVTFMECHLLCT